MYGTYLRALVESLPNDTLQTTEQNTAKMLPIYDGIEFTENLLLLPSWIPFDLW